MSSFSNSNNNNNNMNRVSLLSNQNGVTCSSPMGTCNTTSKPPVLLVPPHNTQQQQQVQIIESFRIMDILLQLFFSGDFQSIYNLVSRGVSVNVQNCDGLSLLQVSVSNGNTSFTQYLINMGANVNIADVSQITPLHIAASKGSLDQIKLLLSAGANINVSDEEGDSPCHYAIRESQIQVLEYLLTKGGANVNAINDEGESLLHLSASLGELEATQLLLSNGASISLQDDCGATPLCEAKSNNHFQIVQLLSNQLHQNNRFPNQIQSTDDEALTQFPFTNFKEMYYGTSKPIYTSYYV